MQKLIILCGEAFSGKSTLSKKLAKHYKAKLFGRDEIYFSLENLLALEETPEDEDDFLWKGMWPLVIQGVRNHLSLGNSVVIDDNCFLFKQREEIRNIAREKNIKNILIYLDTPKEALFKRKEENKISKQRHDVPSSWMAEDAYIFERPTKDEPHIVFKPEDSLENLIEKIEQL
jgi:predicted kinase